MISVGGAIIIATYTGRVIPLPWTNKSKNKPLIKGQLQENTIVGIIYCIIGVSSSAAYTILLAKTLPQYPTPLTLTTGTCLVGALINFTVAQVLGSRYGSRWMIDWNIMFLSYFYAGVMVSAFATYLIIIVTRVKGPVIVIAFSPLSMILVTSIGTIVLAEQVYVGGFGFGAFNHFKCIVKLLCDERHVERVEIGGLRLVGHEMVVSNLNSLHVSLIAR
ncbi:hypothetical protein L1049_003551 [Liquidambar formosana]|uniref:WAT1-related protein n=1 Tax=Liquidambar formosana TaxID=63359 RepID=A0AAP0R407_LIQFO